MSTSQSKEHSKVDDDGTAVHKSESYKAEPGHAEHSTSKSVTDSDGSTSTMHKKESSDMGPGSTSSTTTSTTGQKY